MDYVDGSYFSGNVYETRVGYDTVSASGVNFLLVNNWHDSTGQATEYHGICGLSARTLA